MIDPKIWIGFILLVFIMLAFDLGVLNRNSKTMTTRKAVVNTLGWISLGLLFNVFIYFAYENHWYGLGTFATEPMDGKEASLKFLTGYLLEEALSVDNLFVMALVFAQFQVPKKYQHKILFWGIIGVLVFRGLLISIGIWLVSYFVWLFFFFGGLLIFSALKMIRSDDGDKDLSDNAIMRLIRRIYPVTDHYDGDKFFTIHNGVKMATPLFVVLMVIETTDVLFAFDSVPAVFSITTDPFLVFSSNIFAILGLRSMYFVLANIMDKFVYLKYSLFGILMFIGVKMILIPLHIHIPEMVSLMVIAILLILGVLMSHLKPVHKEHPPAND